MPIAQLDDVVASAIGDEMTDAQYTILNVALDDLRRRAHGDRSQR